ncbi:MAG: DUF4012 domain-containing protein [Actinomycetota bacterium]|nr:DUF4012 domain-containing protein [Actinomycetota bacterium]
MTRSDLPAMAAVAAVGAIAAALAGCRPTGNVVGDALLTGGLAAFTIWIAATAAWWSLVLAGAFTIAAAGAWLPFALGLAGVAVGLYLGDRRASLPPLRCVSAALTVQGLLRLQLHGFFAASALVAGGTMLFLIGVGLQRRRRFARRRILKYVLVGLGVAVVSIAGFALAALGTRSDLEQGYHGMLDGLDQLQSGDPRTAAASLHEAAQHLAAADDSLAAPWSQPARLVPVVAQHQQAIAALVSHAADSAEAAADALDVVDFDALTVDGGHIDIDAIAVMEEPLDRLQAAVTDLQQAMLAADSPWLVQPLAQRLDTYSTRATDVARQARAIHSAAVNAPAMLGADGPRRYLMGFASPAEARGLVGVMGNYAVLTIDDGFIERSEFGRINDLRNALAERPFTLQASPEFHQRYARWGAGAGNDEPAAAGFWSNVTMTPDMPTAGALITQLWEASGGAPIDGVIILDPAALAGLLQATGPIEVPGLATPLTSATVEEFLLLQQYALDTPERRDLLEDVANATLDAVLNGSLPAPQHLAAALGPAATEGHLLMWSPIADEQAMLQLVGLDGALPALAGRDGLAVVTDNAIANKIDSFMERDVRYQADYDASTGVVSGTITVTLTNTAPASGYPDYVIGSEFLDLPQGTNRTLLTVFTPLEQMGATLDGAQQGFNRTTELGWNAYTATIDLPPGASRTLVINVLGAIAPDGYELVLRPQPLARDEQVAVSVHGDADIDYVAALTRRVVVSESGATPVR